MIMDKGSYSQPGLRLLRNKRVIVGTKNKPNKPQILLGTSNKFASQRLYGELHLNTMTVNFLKTGFNDNLDSLYRIIQTQLKDEEMNFIHQATHFRSKMRKRIAGPDDVSTIIWNWNSYTT